MTSCKSRERRLSRRTSSRGVFPTVPLTAEASLTTLGARTEDGAFERALHVRPTGLVELLWALSPHRGDGDQLLLDATEIVAVSMPLAAAVGRAPYADLSSIGSGRRRFGRVDWQFGVATAISTADGLRYWNALRFPDTTPPRAAHDRGFMPPIGCGSEALRSSRRSTSANVVACILLEELLKGNGYYAYGAAIEATITAAARTRLPDGSSHRADDAQAPAVRKSG